MVNGELAYPQQLTFIFTAVEVRTDPVVPNASVTAILLDIPTFVHDTKTGFDGTTDEFWLGTGAQYHVIVESPSMVGDAPLDISDVFRDGYKHYFLVVRMRSKADIEAVKARLVLTASSAWSANAVAQLNNGISDILRSVSFGAVKLVRFEVRGNDVVFDLQEPVRSPLALTIAIPLILGLTIILAIVVIIGIKVVAEYLPKPFVPATNPDTGKPCLPGECGCPEDFVMDKDGRCVPVKPFGDITAIIIVAGVAAAGVAGILLIRDLAKRRR